MRGARTAHIGTSGWHYDHWRGPFYPEDMKPRDYLAFYRERFGTVEINNTFYHLPDPKTFRCWRDAASKGFIFAVKGSRYITHMKKLKHPTKALNKLLGAGEKLGNHLGPILFQLPPRWRCNTERLDAFLDALPKRHRYAFEFRDTSWFNDEVYEILSSHNAAFCMYELGGTKSPKQITADFIYVRLHGPDGKYQGNYTSRQLSRWAHDFSTWSRKVNDIYCYFDNDQRGYAAKNALALQKMMNTSSST